jgi:hypothetical protein
MNIRKRSVISVLIIAAMVFSVGMFASCGNESEEFRYNIRITSWDNSIEDSFDGVLLQLEEFDAAPTVLAATRFYIKDVMQWDFEYDATLNAVKKIGPHISELFRSEFAVECEECIAIGEDEEDEREECDECAQDEVVHEHYYDWVCTVNGVEASPNDVIENGATVVWEWRQVSREHSDEWDIANR